MRRFPRSDTMCARSTAWRVTPAVPWLCCCVWVVSSTSATTCSRPSKSGQRDDGGFSKAGEKGADLETTYRVLRGFVMVKERPADPDKLRGFVARCRNADGGYGLAPGQPSNVTATYFASIILYWLNDR